MAKDKNSFVLYTSYIDVVEVLSDEQAGVLLKHIMQYVNDKDPADPIDPVVKIAWLSIKSALKADLKRYEKKCEQNRANVNKRYNKNTSEYERIQTNTNEYEENSRKVSYYDIDIDIDNDIDNVDNNIIVDNIEKEKEDACTPDYITQILLDIKEKLPEMEDSTYSSLEDFLVTISKKYTKRNISRSVYHALICTLEKYGKIENTFGYLRNAIAINCEQFRNKGHL